MGRRARTPVRCEFRPTVQEPREAGNVWNRRSAHRMAHPLKMYPPFLLKPRIRPELTSTTVAPSEQTISPSLRRGGVCETRDLVAGESAVIFPGAITGPMDPAATAAILFMSVRRLFEGFIDSSPRGLLVEMSTT